MKGSSEDIERIYIKLKVYDEIIAKKVISSMKPNVINPVIKYWKSLYALNKKPYEIFCDVMSKQPTNRKLKVGTGVKFLTNSAKLYQRAIKTKNKRK